MRTICLILLVGCLAACSMVTGRNEANKAPTAEEKLAAKRAEKQAKLKAELQKVAEEARPMIANLLQAMNNNDYERFMRDLNAAMKSAYHDRQLFSRQNEQRVERYGLAGAHPIVRVEKRNPFYNISCLVKFARVEQPVPVLVSCRYEEKKLKIAFVQFRFSEVAPEKERET